MAFTSTSSSLAASATSASPSPTSSGAGNTPVGANQSNPLLFFVALGFGVVFTNLWIIVGVKYCFRYNARNRARLAGHDDVDLQGMARPHRRRREKKLMTMDEVNERFPATKYKTWRATREAMGMPTAGGMAAPEENARQSMQQEAREEAIVDHTPPTIPESVASPTGRLHDSMESKPRTSVLSERHVDATTEDDASAAPKSTAETEGPVEGIEEDEAVAAVPEDLANTSGDTCAICIDNLEDVDDIRGLTCGHAFHTGCLDPWLTSRRACCPLCKHDYFVPKPRSEAEIAADEAARERRRLAHEQMMARPGRLWLYRMHTFVAPVLGSQPPSHSSRRRHPSRRPQAPSSGMGFFRSNNPAVPNGAADPASGNTTANRSFFGRFRRNDNNIAMNAVGTNTAPSDLESGLNAPLSSLSSPDPVHPGPVR